MGHISLSTDKRGQSRKDPVYGLQPTSRHHNPHLHPAGPPEALRSGAQGGPDGEKLRHRPGSPAEVKVDPNPRHLTHPVHGRGEGRWTAEAPGGA